MQVVNYLRARFCNSSYAAFNLAQQNSKYIKFAKNIVSVKNEDVKCKFEKLTPELQETSELSYKKGKYNFILRHLAAVEDGLLSKNSRSDLLSFENKLPRLVAEKINSNSHEYFLPYNNKPAINIITGMKENLI